MDGINLIIDLNHWQDHCECGSLSQSCRDDSDLASMQSHYTRGDEETQPTALTYSQSMQAANESTQSIHSCMHIKGKKVGHPPACSTFALN